MTMAITATILLFSGKGRDHDDDDDDDDDSLITGPGAGGFVVFDGEIPLAANKSSALCVALVMWSTNGSSSCSRLPFQISSEEGLLSASWRLSSCSLGS